MSGQYDIIIIGSGPNGLAIGAYLSKAGQKVLLLEKRYEAGGGLATEQITLPDFFHNTHAIFHMMVDYAPIYPGLQVRAAIRRQAYPPLSCNGQYPCLMANASVYTMM
jgi:phytoene dehydrogenase-like protein